MFEGLVRQLIVGYLGRYIKDIHKEQLKITLWNEEVKLENVELILEAFDYLQLPCALKEGRVGRLSIKIPWKKLGWDPIIISLDDVLVCACQRNDEEWSKDAVERREFAGKKAKLAAAELAKLSKRFSDDQAGTSFISFITAKILDGIQVSIRNVHVLYRDMLTDGAHVEFGLKFSSLTLMKQSPAGVSSGKVRGNQVAKLVEVQSLEIYCRTFQRTLDGIRIGNDGTEHVDSTKNLHEGHINVLAPVDVSISLLVNRPGNLESDAPQYSINFTLTGLVISLDEVQLQEILNLYDYLSTCRLRERYGQYRPWASPLSKKVKGWQKLWWQYAQQSVLSDVCKRLRKTSWKYLGERLSRRHKYVKLYKTKLECLRQELLLDDDVLWELEQIEKEADIDEILDYRSVAECVIEEFLEDSSSSFGAKVADVAADNSVDDEHSSSKPRGWLNWLSRGMLGAGGTDDSSQFSGVVSDEVIKDIYEATKFYSVPSLSGETASDEIFLSSVKFNINQITATLRSMKHNRAIADLLFEGVFIECKMWEKSALVTSTINSAQIVNPSNKQVILVIRRAITSKHAPELMETSVNIQVDLSPPNHDNELSVKVMLQSLEFTFDSDFILNVMELYQIIGSFTFQQERVLSSLNGIDDDKVRLLSKAEYMLSSRKRVMWDVQIFHNLIGVIWQDTNADTYKMVLESQALIFRSIRDMGSASSDMSYQPCLFGFQLSDLYDCFEIKLDDFEINLLLPLNSQTLSILDKLGVSLTLSSCILPDEPMLKSSEVYIIISSLLAHFSLSRYCAILELISNFSALKPAADPAMLKMAASSQKQFSRARTSNLNCFSVVANLGSASLLVDLENGTEHSCILKLSLHELNFRLSIAKLSEWWIGCKALKVITCPIKNEDEIRTLCSAKATVSNSYAQAHGADGDKNIVIDRDGTSDEKCLLLYYQGRRNSDLNHHKYLIWFNDVDLHFYPYIIGQLVGFSDKLAKCGASHVTMARAAVESCLAKGSGFEIQRFGFSNYFDRNADDLDCIPVDQFPFITSNNDGPLLNFESSLKYAVPEWRDLPKSKERKIRSPRFSFKKQFEQVIAQPVDPRSDDEVLPTSLPVDRADMFAVELNLSSVRLHFHDSASLIGTVTVPTSISSIVICDGCFDVLFSCEGVTLSSAWCNQHHSNILWGSLLPNLSSILNIRVRKGMNGSLGSMMELSISVQHVSCILPPEYLAILIGYFTISDWRPNAKQHSVAETFELANTETKINLKFEVLDSALFVPAGNDDFHLLKLNIQQLLCSFIENCSSEIVLNDIPVDCLVPVHKVDGKNDCWNISARDLSLQLLLLKDDASDFLVSDKSATEIIATLISELSADVWIRVPCKSVLLSVGSSPLCIMARICHIQFTVEGVHVLAGYEILLDVINQFSSVDADSRGFTSDVEQFLQFKRSTKERKGVLAESSSVQLTEIKCSFNSVSLKLYTSKCDLPASVLTFEAETQFLCYASLRIGEPHYLDISFSTVSLFSLTNSVRLLECCSSSVVSEFNILTAAVAEFEARVSLPPLDIWFYSSDWSEFIDLCSSYFKHTPENPIVKVSSRKSINDLVEQAENEVDVSNPPQSDSVSSTFASSNMKPGTSLLLLKSENITTKVHIPVRVSGEVFGEFTELQVHKDSSDMYEADHYGFIVFTLESKSSELVFDGKSAKVKSNIGKINGTVELCKEISERVWRFFQILQVNLEANISTQVDLMQITGEVRCDSIDVWLSHHIFYICRCIMRGSSSQGSSQFAFGKTDLNLNLRRLSILLIDGKQSSNGPLLEVLLRHSILCAVCNDNNIQTSFTGDLQVNYNNFHKVLWEPFVEPWKFNLSLNWRNQNSVLLNTALMADMSLSSTSELNLNVTESFVEVVFRAIDMIADAWGLQGLTSHSASPSFLKNQTKDGIYNGRYAPYRIQNLTSLPLAFRVIEGPLSTYYSDASASEDEIVVQPGSSIPIYIDESPEEQLFRYRPAHSSERLSDKQFMYTAHRYVTIRLEGTSVPSTPISMDLVGLSCFHVDFSKSAKSLKGDTPDGLKTNSVGKNKAELDSGYVVPVVVDVSVQRYTKLIRLYSTVVLSNATSTPFEVRFDIPFGVSPKMLDPINPGQEFPLPLHLAESGRMRWRPVGNSYLWSEAYNISSIIGHENNVGVLRSVVCYPSHPSSDPFRFCLSVRDMCLPASGRQDGTSQYSDNTVKQSFENSRQVMPAMDESKKYFLHLVTISTPLVVSNFLPVSITLEIESGGVTRSAILTEVENSFFHIDSSHDLAMVFKIHGYGPSVLKFPRAEKFGAMAKFSGTKFSASETISFNSDLLSEGNLFVSIELIMDAVSGAREIYISVPFLLYNCTAFPLVVSNCVSDMKVRGCTLPSCFNLEEDLPPSRKDGLSLLISDQDFQITLHNGNLRKSSDNHIVSTRKLLEPHSSTLPGTSYREIRTVESTARSSANLSGSSSQSNSKFPDFVEFDHKRVGGCMYSPVSNSSASDIKVQVSRGQPKGHKDSSQNCIWSNPFSLAPSTGSIRVPVPYPSPNSGYIIAVTSTVVTGPISGRTRMITFQPRYVISNACSRNLYYKQKGTDSISHLRVGQHSQIHWADSTLRDLLVSVRFDEPSWQWSGCFLPEHLGDTQLKMRNHVSGALNMIRVEVQNADVLIGDEKIGGNYSGNSGTNLILISDDDTGYMPYRVDNFSKERLRIYQQKCETFETIVHTYTSCPYAWDEPCLPHRLIVEVPGERVLGSYALDEVQEFSPVYLCATSEKPERTLLVYVQAEGAVKVLSVVDSSCHSLNDLKGPRVTSSNVRGKEDNKQETSTHDKEKLSFFIPFIGISVMNSHPQELLYISARNMTVDLGRSIDQETFSIQLSSLQIDNQLPSTPYPVILSFEYEIRNNPVGQMRRKDDNTRLTSDSEVEIVDGSCDPVFTLAAAKWRNTDTSLVSFEYISLKVADFHLELEQEVIQSVSSFFKTISSRFSGDILPDGVSMLNLTSEIGLVDITSTYAQGHEGAESADQISASNIPIVTGNHKSCSLLPSVVPIGAPWQQIYLLARTQKKIYVELLDLAPINLTLSFSSSPWMLMNGVLTSGESVIHRGLMALADIEGAQIHLNQLLIVHQLASWESIQVILIRHYKGQFLHEIYKVFGSAGVIGNPMGFARSVGQGIRDFLSVPAKSLVKNPTGLFTGMAQGTTSLLSNTVYAISDATTQFSRAAHKGIVAFTFDDQSTERMEKQQFGISSHSKGVINEILEGLTGLLQSPIRGAERHGLPGILSGIALGVTGLVARPAASILEVTGKTALSIRNRSKLYHMGSHRLRVRLPRPLSRESPLRPYSWEEAIGTSVLSEFDSGLKLKDDILVLCRRLKQGGKFVIITERLVLLVSCLGLLDLGKPRFRGIPADPEWVTEAEIGMDSVIHADADNEVVHIVGSSSDTLSRQKQYHLNRNDRRRWNSSSTPIPLYQTNLEFTCMEEAENFLQVLLATVRKGQEQGWGYVNLLHQSNLK